MIHFGPYEGRTVEDVIELDPSWVISNSKEHGIIAEAVRQARINLDLFDEHEDAYPSWEE